MGYIVCKFMRVTSSVPFPTEHNGYHSLTLWQASIVDKSEGAYGNGKESYGTCWECPLNKVGWQNKYTRVAGHLVPLLSLSWCVGMPTKDKAGFFAVLSDEKLSQCLLGK